MPVAKENISVSVVVPRKMHEKLVSVADKRERSLSFMLCKVIEQWQKNGCKLDI